MNKMRISLIPLVLGLAALASAAWGAESVMSLISNGEAVQKEVVDTKAAMEASEKKNHDLAAEGNKLTSDQKQLQADVAAWQKENDELTQRVNDNKANCGPDKKLNTDQYNACKAQVAQLNSDIAKVNAENADLNKRNKDINERIPKYNDAIKGIGDEIKQGYAAYNAALKKEAAWLDQARTQMSSSAFASYGKKAGCPDVNKNAKTPEAMIQMSADVIACLKRVSAG
jgi:cell division protein FtsB